jgi:CBS domain containing-hemolysin-like protein
VYPRTEVDPIDTFIGVVAVVVLVAINGFFVAGEFALVALDPARAEHLAERRPRRARMVSALLERLSFHLAGAQLGITVSSLVLGFVAQDALGGLLDGLPGVSSSGAQAAVLALVIATVFQMVFGELIPKNLAIARPDVVSFALAPMQRTYGVLARPVISAFDGSANALVRRLGMEPAEKFQSVRSRDEIARLIVSSGESGTLAEGEHDLLTRSIRFGELDAADVLQPRPDMVCLQRGDMIADLRAASIRTGHSRFPVLGEDLDDIVGIVDVRDVFTLDAADRDATPLVAILRDALYVPESRELSELLGDMRDTSSRMALVLDEHGGTAGIVTLEDLLEELVGDIADEYDVPVALTATPRAGAYEVDGSLHLNEVLEAVGVAIQDGPYETLAGFVLSELGRIPALGDSIVVDEVTYTVLVMDKRRISKVAIRPAPHGGGHGL